MAICQHRSSLLNMRFSDACVVGMKGRLMMDGLRSELALQSIGAVHGSVPPEKFRQWLMSRMLDFESSGDDELIDLVFSFELLGFEFQRGDRDAAGYIAALREEAAETWLSPFLDVHSERTVIRLEHPLREFRTATKRDPSTANSIKATLYTDSIGRNSDHLIGIMHFQTR